MHFSRRQFQAGPVGIERSMVWPVFALLKFLVQHFRHVKEGQEGLWTELMRDIDGRDWRRPVERLSGFPETPARRAGGTASIAARQSG
jgi:hypothetical protein